MMKKLEGRNILISILFIMINISHYQRTRFSFPKNLISSFSGIFLYLSKQMLVFLCCWMKFGRIVKFNLGTFIFISLFLLICVLRFLSYFPNSFFFPYFIDVKSTLILLLPIITITQFLKQLTFISDFGFVTQS